MLFALCALCTGLLVLAGGGLKLRILSGEDLALACWGESASVGRLPCRAGVKERETEAELVCTIYIYVPGIYIHATHTDAHRCLMPLRSPTLTKMSKRSWRRSPRLRGLFSPESRWSQTTFRAPLGGGWGSFDASCGDEEKRRCASVRAPRAVRLAEVWGSANRRYPGYGRCSRDTCACVGF